jgi:hypothetical protein
VGARSSVEGSTRGTDEGGEEVEISPSPVGAGDGEGSGGPSAMASRERPLLAFARTQALKFISQWSVLSNWRHGIYLGSGRSRTSNSGVLEALYCFALGCL